MKKVFVTITGLNYRFGAMPFENCKFATCEKEPNNEFDPEAIKVSVDGFGTVGYIANSVKTRKGESLSAGAVGMITKNKFKVKVISSNDCFAIAKIVKGLK